MLTIGNLGKQFRPHFMLNALNSLGAELYDNPHAERIMAAYMFVLYFGIAADLTPPVALAAYAGAGIARADAFRTGTTATKLALAGFLVPYIYAYNPILVLVDFEFLPFALAVTTALIGVFLLGMSTIGFFRAPISLDLRVLALYSDRKSVV